MGDRRSEAASLLEETLWAQGFSSPELETLAGYMGLRRLTKGTTVITEGKPGESMFIIAEGSFEISKLDSAGEGKPITVLTKGKAVGEIALFDRQPRSASVVARQPGIVLELTRENLERLAADHPKLGTKLLFKLAGILAQRLRATSGKWVEK